MSGLQGTFLKDYCLIVVYEREIEAGNGTADMEKELEENGVL